MLELRDMDVSFQLGQTSYPPLCSKVPVQLLPLLSTPTKPTCATPPTQSGYRPSQAQTPSPPPSPTPPAPASRFAFLPLMDPKPMARPQRPPPTPLGRQMPYPTPDHTPPPDPLRTRLPAKFTVGGPPAVWPTPSLRS